MRVRGENSARAAAREFARTERRRELSNFSLFRSRDCAGQVASMHQSGTHWLKFMLASALAHRHGIPGPRFNHANDIIGGPRDPIVYPQLPRILSSHSMPQRWLGPAMKVGAVRLPPYVVLVRDMRLSLVSNYRKWSDRYDVPFGEFLRGDPRGRRFNSDLWWCIGFLNAWTRLRRAHGGVLVVRYEDLERDAAAVLAAISAHLELALAPAAIAAGVAAGTKDTMAARDDPARPPGAIQWADRPWPDWYEADDRRWLEHTCDRHLLDSYGYDYHAWDPRPATSE